MHNTSIVDIANALEFLRGGEEQVLSYKPENKK